ncbi:MAG: Gfo/Idh/MocA family oxidoreductase [Gemmatimonadota bacterium]
MGTMIRIGMINTCIHAYLYGACFGPYDRYQYILGGGQTDIMESSSVPVIPFKNTVLGAVWSREKAHAEQFARAFGCPIVDRREDLAAVVDAIFIANAGGPGDDHAEIAIPFLEKGIPVNVDKPLEASLEKARELIAAAQRTGTPVFCSSLLHYARATEELKALDLGEVRMVVATGGGDFEQVRNATHTFGTLTGFMGPGIRSAYAIGPKDQKGATVRFLWQDGRIGIVQMNGARGEFQLDVFGTKGSAMRQTLVPEYRYGAVGMARAWVSCLADAEKKPPLPYDHLLEIVAAVRAAQISRAEGREVELTELG